MLFESQFFIRAHICIDALVLPCHLFGKTHGIGEFAVTVFFRFQHQFFQRGTRVEIDLRTDERIETDQMRALFH